MPNRMTIALLVLFVLAGCASIQTMVDKNPEADFDAYETWGWYPGERAPTGDPRIDMDKPMHEYIRAAVSREMSARGYRFTQDAPALYVDYHVTIQDEVNSQVINNYYGESYYPEYQLGLPSVQETYQFSWTQGALLILVFDAQSRKLVWRGLAQAEVNTQGPRKEAREKLDSAVEKLIKQLPKT